MVSIQGRRVNLREIEVSDLCTLYYWRNDPRFMGFCSTRRNQVTLEEFREELRVDLSTDRWLQCLILQQDFPIGTIYAYGLNLTDGHVFITTYLDQDHENSGFGAEAFILFSYHLFQFLPLFKVYTEAYSYNTKSLTIMKKGGFVEEGRFKGHRLYNGERFDLIRLAFFKDQVPQWERFAERLKNHNQEPGLTLAFYNYQSLNICKIS